MAEQQRRYLAANSEDEGLDLSDHTSHLTLSRSSRSSASLSSSLGKYEDYVNLLTSVPIELRILGRYSLPLIITFILEHFFSIVCLLVVGHLGKDELAAVSLATMTSTITYAIFEGIATALDTLCPQAYGAGRFDLVSEHVQRCILFSWVVFIPCAFLWWNSSFFLRYIIESAQVLRLTNQFLRIMIVGGPAYIFFECGKRFLQAQGIFEAGTVILFVSAPLNIFLSWFLVWNKTYGVGYVGAPIATVINFYFMCLLMVLYVVFIDGSECWFGVASLKHLFKKWAKLSHLAIPGIIMLESEYMAYEIITLFASRFGTVPLAAQSAVSSMASLTYMIPYAVSIAASTRIASFIGGGNAYSAKVSTNVSLFIGLVVAVINCFALYTFKYQIAMLFSKDQEVIDEIVQLLNPLVSIIQIFDGLASVASGIIRAQGMQKIGGVINLVAYYAFALPLAMILSDWYGYGLIGLWLGIGSGMVVIGVSETALIFFTNWEKLITEHAMV
ncbi:hypothetical protein QFC19_005689 [Naganishia cerealis]|uniref:Uncharacterized protein n=1 Tax=Naganishia cerealis TaxID=610337 RepID=A0ACC2VN08_9TREE|nr:hypothetical protein QFC19_005689 [Naganishia cerealis]